MEEDEFNVAALLAPSPAVVAAQLAAQQAAADAEADRKRKARPAALLDALLDAPTVVQDPAAASASGDVFSSIPLDQQQQQQQSGGLVEPPATKALPVHDPLSTPDGIFDEAEVSGSGERYEAVEEDHTALIDDAAAFGKKKKPKSKPKPKPTKSKQAVKKPKQLFDDDDDDDENDASTLQQQKQNQTEGGERDQGEDDDEVGNDEDEDDDEEDDQSGGRARMSLQAEWDETFTGNEFMLSLKARGLTGTLRASRFRSVGWKLFLGALPHDRSQWLASTLKDREEYAQLRKSTELDPHEVPSDDLMTNNPLSAAENNPWQQYFKDRELRQVIKQDVTRTFPESEFFQSSPLQEMMLNILFCYTRTHSDLSYRQGMHELLAPILFLMHKECKQYDRASSEISDEIRTMLDASFIEHDAYVLFSKVMSATADWYAQGDAPKRVPKPAPTFITAPFADAKEEEQEKTSDIVKKLKHIQHKLLQDADPTLYAHLQNLQIEPQLYGLRWVRLLVGREFHMDDVITIWDAIFADSPFLSLIDYFCVAMLLYIREPLLISDYMGCLKRLMRFPPVEDVVALVERALELREPRTGRTDRRPQQASSAVPPAVINFAATSAPSVSVASSSTSQYVPPSSRGQFLSAGAATKHHPAPKKDKASTLFNIIGSTTSSIKAAVTKAATNSSSSSSSHSQRSAGGYSAGASTTQAASRPGRSGSVNGPGPKNSQLEEALATVRTMNAHCGEQMQGFIRTLEAQVLGKVAPNRETALVALAGLKQIKDMLRGNLPFDASQAGGAVDADSLHNSSNDLAALDDDDDHVLRPATIISPAAAALDAPDNIFGPGPDVIAAPVELVGGDAQDDEAATIEDVSKPSITAKAAAALMFGDDEDADTSAAAALLKTNGANKVASTPVASAAGSTSKNAKDSNRGAQAKPSTAASGPVVAPSKSTIVNNIFSAGLDDENEDIFSVAKQRKEDDSNHFVSSIGKNTAAKDVDAILGGPSPAKGGSRLDFL
ncbi:TBC1 domain family protein [Capsaspora owczarzaki ATCC 30864]|uniref:TBC1 domain family protein n=1 Tax=Capsaspora owczarzaki (strain ATCC 30864) TaxID=595528 RepID=A0A0D2X3X9_CAPO3|nr:TBC1 domain family protein [Capsaspora owczarzaki ATCC 30864]KJE95089.1 TBC1 domain family protein [Capsaspora owczarzaki ATCC 30864]|eukprot:XP_004346254.2 TBC1 domain family protein [Capsaspora owczarzaki ATCC 30864]